MKVRCWESEGADEIEELMKVKVLMKVRCWLR
jgi:hypothetical protein